MHSRSTLGVGGGIARRITLMKNVFHLVVHIIAPTEETFVQRVHGIIQVAHCELGAKAMMGLVLGSLEEDLDILLGFDGGCLLFFS
jgi:hypothetical protein